MGAIIKTDLHKGDKKMITEQNVMQLVASLVWLLAGVGVFIVGMNFMSSALEKSAGSGREKHDGHGGTRRAADGTGCFCRRK